MPGWLWKSEDSFPELFSPSAMPPEIEPKLQAHSASRKTLSLSLTSSGFVPDRGFFLNSSYRMVLQLDSHKIAHITSVETWSQEDQLSI